MDGGLSTGFHVTLLGLMDFWINKENGRLLLPTCLSHVCSGMYHQVFPAGNAKGRPPWFTRDECRCHGNDLGLGTSCSVCLRDQGVLFPV